VLHDALIAAAVIVALYGAFVVTLVAAGRREEARAWADLVPDCVVLVRRLLGDERVPRARKLLLGAMLVYLAIPIDLVPDVIPIAGQLDDAIVVVLVLRSVLRGAGAELVRELWPGPERSLSAILRLAGQPA
jgi:uncharacterized membrane protein YkvA (DUF1232 family)